MRVRITPLAEELEPFEGIALYPPTVGIAFTVEEDDGDTYWVTGEVTAIGLGYTEESRYLIEVLGVSPQRPTPCA